MYQGDTSPNRGLYANTGYGPGFAVLEFGSPDRVAVVEPETAFWALVERSSLDQALSGDIIRQFEAKSRDFAQDMEHLRSGLKPSAVYLNPTERCNLNCSYCYLPEEMRRNGRDMQSRDLLRALEKLKAYFNRSLPPEATPQLIFHGSEPLLAKEAVFDAIERYSGDFHFGIQTNGTLLDDESIAFLKRHEVGVGLSLDGPRALVSDRIRKNWGNQGVFDRVHEVLYKLKDYPALNVITTVTRENVYDLEDMVDFYHELGVGVVMMNPVRCTRQGGTDLKPDNQVLAREFIRALERSYQLYQKTGRKLVIANFANALAGIIGPTGRRLMCDISPCGGGRCFFAVASDGQAVPCSEFIGLDRFFGGNIFERDPETILASEPFTAVTERKVENITPCYTCAIRHFCGSPCPAETYMSCGGLNTPSPYCSFFEEQVRYAFRLISEGREEAFLWDTWEDETEVFHSWK